MTQIGIDVSAWQNLIDFAALKDEGKVSFVYAKCTEGADSVDVQYVRNRNVCRERGIPFGAYHFFRFGQDPIAQATHFMNNAMVKAGDLLPMVDVEGGGQDGVTDLQTLIYRLSAFTHEVERQIGKRIIIYSDYGDWNGFMQGTSAFSGHPFWIAEYNNDDAPTLPGGFTSAVIWQYTDALSVAGISGNVDGDKLLVPITEITL